VEVGHVGLELRHLRSAARDLLCVEHGLFSVELNAEQRGLRLRGRGGQHDGGARARRSTPQHARARRERPEPRVEALPVRAFERRP
jgi:hypothetical protein